MVSDELIISVKDQFRQGKRRNEIKENLINQGFAEEDINTAIIKIQHEAVKQLPGIARIYQLIEHLESRENLKTTRMTITILIICIIALFFLAGGLYIFFDPLGTRSTARDAQRIKDMATVQTAVAAFYKINHYYPKTLDALVPQFLSTVPYDPQTGALYRYRALDNNNYELCATLELQQTQCVYAARPTISEIPVVPTTTPTQTFIPQKASPFVSSPAM